MEQAGGLASQSPGPMSTIGTCWRMVMLPDEMSKSRLTDAPDALQRARQFEPVGNCALSARRASVPHEPHVDRVGRLGRPQRAAEVGDGHLPAPRARARVRERCD
jgi:hypothetical protein